MRTHLDARQTTTATKAGGIKKTAGALRSSFIRGIQSDLSARKLYLHWNIPRADVNSSQKGGQSCSASRPRSRLTQVTPREASPTHGETHGLCVCATVAPSLTTVRSTLSCTYIFKGCTPLSRALLPALGWSRDDGVGRRYRPGLLLPLDDRLLPSRFLEDGVWGTSSSVPSPFSVPVLS